MSTTGAGLAISGSSDQGNAAEAQYQKKDDGNIGSDDVAGEDQGAADPVEQAAVVDDGGSLPFTGFLAIPLIVGGVALLTGGALLRWRSRD